MIELYLEALNALISLATLSILLLILWFQVKRKNLFKSLLFLKEQKLRISNIIITFGVIFFLIRELYEALELFGFEPEDVVAELFETISISLFFIGALRVFLLLYSRKKELV